MLFFGALTPTAGAVIAGAGALAVSLAVGAVIQSVVIEMAKGAIYGAIGAYALTALGYGACTMATAVAVGALVGVAVFLPLSLIQGLTGIFLGVKTADAPEPYEEPPPFTQTMAAFSLRVGIIFLSSLIVSTTLFLGSMPAAAIATGAAITDFAIEAVKDVANFAMNG